MYQVRKHPNKIMFTEYEVCNHLLEVRLLDWQMDSNDFLTPFVHACTGNLVRADVVQVPAVATSCAHHSVDVLSRNSAGSIWQSGKTVCWSQVCILLANLWISNNCNFIPPPSHTHTHSVIGLNIGSCIAFFVIIGDLAPPIVAQATGLQWVRREPNHHSRCLPITATELVVQ